MTESRNATDGLSKALDSIINEVRNRGWGENVPKKNLKMTNFPRFSYLTDLDAHNKELRKPGEDLYFHLAGCKCPPITQMSKWARAGKTLQALTTMRGHLRTDEQGADWAKENVEVEGHKGQKGDQTQIYCLRPDPGKWDIR